MFNSWTINLISGIILTVMLGGGYWLWKNSVEEAAIARNKIELLEAQVKDQQKLMEDLNAINQESNNIIFDLKSRENELNQKLSDLEQYLKNDKNPHESSEVLKRTFKELSR